MRDISNRHDDVFRALLERSADMLVAIIDARGCIGYATPSLADLVGRPCAALVGAPCFDFVNPHDRSRCRQMFDRLMAGSPRRVSGRLRVLRPDGAARSIEITAVNRLNDPDLRGIVLQCHDITRRERARHARRRRRDQFRAAFVHAMDAILILDDDRRCLDANPGACGLMGLERHEILTRRLDDLVPADRRSALETTWDEFLQTGEQTGEQQIRRADGTIRTIEYASRARVLPGRHLAVVRDLTERRNLEETLRQMQKVEMVGRLAGGVAHDFNNIMTAILGYTELLLRQVACDSRFGEDLREIRRAAERASALTYQLLAFSRKQVLQPRIVDVNATVENLDKMLRRLIREDIELHACLAPALASVEIDPSQLEQVVVNLVVNAKDALPHGGRLRIETANVTMTPADARLRPPMTPGPYVMLSVTDNGTGMTAETRARVFEPFFTTKELGRGTGLGLATVYGIIKQSGGFIWVDSEPGRGTSFHIYLPTVDARPDVNASEPSSDALPRGSETVLLVEDEDVVRAIAREVLTRSGYTVLEAGDPDRAAAITQEYAGQIDLLLTDVVLPLMHGPALAERLTAVRPEMRVLFMSGYTEAALPMLRARQNQPAFLHKPFMPLALATKVRQTLDAEAPSTSDLTWHRTRDLEIPESSVRKDDTCDAR